MTPNHWTMQSLGDFAYWVASDFTAQIETRLEAKEIARNDFAIRLNVSLSRVSQVLNDPGNLTLGNVVKYARALGMKVAIVAYDDTDPSNENGPINAEVFTKCWERLGKPKDLFDLQDTRAWMIHGPISAGSGLTQPTNTSSKIPFHVQETAVTHTLERRRYA